MNDYDKNYCIIGEFFYSYGEWYEHRGPYENFVFVYICIAGEYHPDGF